MVIRLEKFGGGVINDGRQGFGKPADSLHDGQNVVVGQRGFRTRPGTEVVSLSGLGGRIDGLWQPGFAMLDKAPMVAQVTTAGGSGWLCGQSGGAPGSGAGWYTVTTLSSGAGRLCSAGLGDRHVWSSAEIAPVIWLHPPDADGSQWARPKKVLVTRDGGVTYNDVSHGVKDRSAVTTESVGGFGAATGWICVLSDVAQLSGVYLSPGTTNTSGGYLTLQAHGSSAWAGGGSCTDGTSGLTVAGSVVVPGGLTAVHSRHGEHEGYWFRVISSAGMSAGTTVSSVRMGGPAQAAVNHGDGSFGRLEVFCHYDYSITQFREWANEVGDGNAGSVARLSDADAVAPSGFSTQDSLYVGMREPFSGFWVKPHNDYQNNNVATLSATYWNGTAWAALAITDGTRNGAGHPFSQMGNVSWLLPSDWRAATLPVLNPGEMYYVRLVTSSLIDAYTMLSEASGLVAPRAFGRYSRVASVRDRCVWCGSTADEAAVDVTRAGEVCGLAGLDYAELRCSPGQQVIAACGAFNQLFISTPDDWYILNGYNAQTFALERAEGGGVGPVNQEVLVRAAHSEDGQINTQGLYYVNGNGAYHFGGLRATRIDRDCPWWAERDTGLRVDRKNMQVACGCYASHSDEVMFSVPLILSGAGTSETNNGLLVYDAARRIWQPEATLSWTALAAIRNARENSPGGYGETEVYGGDVSGRIWRMSPELVTDGGAAIVCSATTQWITLGDANQGDYVVRGIGMYSRTSGAVFNVTVSRDGQASGFWSGNLSGAATASGAVAWDYQSLGMQCRHVRIKTEWSGYGEVHGYYVDAQPLRGLGK